MPFSPRSSSSSSLKFLGTAENIVEQSMDKIISRQLPTCLADFLKSKFIFFINEIKVQYCNLLEFRSAHETLNFQNKSYCRFYKIRKWKISMHVLSLLNVWNSIYYTRAWLCVEYHIPIPFEEWCRKYRQQNNGALIDARRLDNNSNFNKPLE